MTAAPLLAMKAIVKTYAGVHALDHVDLTLTAGSVHALVGENGAGKSTMIKVMTGATRASEGTISLRGQALPAFGSPQDAQAHGIVAVYQEVEVLAHRSVAENLLLGREPRRWGLIDWEAMHEKARDVLHGLGLDLDPRAILGELPIALRQMVGIARGASLSENVLVLDEPTSSLAAREIDQLFALVAKVKERGRAIVYISHRFDEIYAICDTVTVLRDGKHVATSALASLDRLELVAQMLGKPIDALRARERQTGKRDPSAKKTVPGDVMLRAIGLRRAPMLCGVNVEARQREIVGLAGLLGSGRTETLRAVFGADAVESGSVEIGGVPLATHHPRDAIAAGVGFLAEDRRADGIVPELSIRENLTLAILPRLGRFGYVSRAREVALTDALVKKLRVKCRSMDQPIQELSGGNQQKVLLARWLCRDPKLLLVDEPTRGIDIGARGEIHTLLAELAESGVAIVLVSSEIDELADTSTRVVVIRDGLTVAELTHDEIETRAIVRAIAGATDEPPHAEVDAGAAS